MKVNELISILKKYDPDMRVMTLGYEGGLHDCSAPRLKRVKLNIPDHAGVWYYGPHDTVDRNEEGDIDALVLGRG